MERKYSVKLPDEMKDTFVSCGEVFVQWPVQDVGYIWAEGVTCAGVHSVLGDLPVCHAGALKSRRLNALSRVVVWFQMFLNAPHKCFSCTCRMLSDLLMSPDDKVTMAFIPSGVMSML